MSLESQPFSWLSERSTSHENKWVIGGDVDLVASYEFPGDSLRPDAFRVSFDHPQRGAVI